MHTHNYTTRSINVLYTSTTATSTPVKLPSLLPLLFFLRLLPLSKVLVKLNLLLLRLRCSPTLSTFLVEIILTLVGHSADGETLITILAFARWGEEVSTLSSWSEVAAETMAMIVLVVMMVVIFVIVIMSSDVTEHKA